MAIRIVTDSSADLPADLAQRWNVTVLPAYVILDDVSHRDGVDLSPDDFYRRLAAGPRLPTTSQPTSADFEAVYRGLLEQGHQVLSIHLSAKLSGTLNSAQQAKTSLGESSPIRIIDSGLASIPMGLAVLDAAQLAAQSEDHLAAHAAAGSEAHPVTDSDGAQDPLDQTASQIRLRLPGYKAFFLLDTLEYLEKGGRIGKAQFFLGSMLSVKPILTLAHGEVHPVERPRTRAKGLARLGELVRQQGTPDRLAVIYSTEPEAAQELCQTLSDLAPQDQIILTRFSPVLGAYVGPNALGVAVYVPND
jgi:fatty acid-binding protein DegV